MNKLTSIIVDDEEGARDVLENLLKRFCGGVEVVDKCGNIQDAVTSINKWQPDLVFLDIEMPDYAGYEIVNFFTEIHFDIVFVTAYDRYAVRAFEISAVDYLLKPIDITRLKEAVDKVEKRQHAAQQNQRLALLSHTLESRSIKKIAVSDRGQQHIIPVEHIVAIEAQESYCLIHTTTQKITASKNLRHFETLLEPLSNFLRTHKSWLINKDHLLHYSKSEFTLQLNHQVTARYSKYKKAELEEALKK